MNAILMIMIALLMLGAPSTAMPSDQIQMPDKTWLMLETDTGTIFRIDPKSVHQFESSHPMRGMAVALVYRDYGQRDFHIENLQRLLFNCDGLFSIWGYPGQWMPAPPKSAVGMIADLACGKTNPDETRGLK